MTKIHWAKLDDEYTEQLESRLEDGEDSSTIGDILFDVDEDNWDLTMDSDQFSESKHFNLKVTDETGKVVYKTKKTESIYAPWEDDEEDETDSETTRPQIKVPEIQEGVYLVSVEELKQFTLTSEFETDNFDPSKFQLFENLEIAAIMTQDTVDFNQFYYGNQRLEMEEQEDYDEYGTTLYKVTFEDSDSEIEEIE